MISYPCIDKALNLHDIYLQLFSRYGKQYWWPGDTIDEIIIGAILTQNTNWSNVSKAINNLKQVNACTLASCATMELDRLEELIRPSGFYRIKAVRLKNASVQILELQKQSLPLHEFRIKLLSIPGIGPETADSIMLYAFEYPVFVIDAYTRRILSRIGLISEKAYYHEVQDLFHHSLSENVQMFNEYHALIVRHAKEVCKKTPSCQNCIWGNP